MGRKTHFLKFTFFSFIIKCQNLYYKYKYRGEKMKFELVGDLYLEKGFL